MSWADVWKLAVAIIGSLGVVVLAVLKLSLRRRDNFVERHRSVEPAHAARSDDCAP